MKSALDILPALASRVALAAMGILSLVSATQAIEAGPPEKAVAANVAAKQEKDATASDVAAERAAVWNSPPMLAARAWLDDYFRRSSQYTPAQAKAYTARLEKLSADEMRLWLAQLNQSMLRTEQDQRNAAADRLYRQARANAVQQQRAINLAKLSAAQTQRARYAQSQINAQQRFSESLIQSRTASRDQTLRSQLATRNQRTLQILTLLDIQELRADLRSSRGTR